MRKTNIFLYILIALTLCCVVLGIVGAIMTYNDVQKYTIIETNAYGYSSTSVGHIYHDLEVSLIVSGTSLLALSLLFLLLARYVKIKNRQLFAIGAVFVYLICMILLILATTTYYSYDGIILYAQRIDIDPTCLALMIATAVILGVLAIATIVYVVITTISAKKHHVLQQAVQRHNQQSNISSGATLANSNEETPTLHLLSYEEGARQLLSFKSLYDCGILTEEEFIAQKQRIISSID